MKHSIFILLAFILFTTMVSIPKIMAEEDPAEKDKYSTELLIRYFESRYTPKDLLHKAQKEAMYLEKQCITGESACKKAIDEFNKPFTKWNQLDGFSPFSQIHNYDKGSVEAHPNPKLHKLRHIENLVYKFKDHSGRICVLPGFKKIKDQPHGVWIVQYTTFINAATKIATPLYLYDVLVDVPGTPYHVSAVMPARGNSIEEMDKMVEYLDSMTEFWSIME